ncbi:MAG: hypothetical protein ACYTBJ_13075 [Planctomycetota bacterium]|jgi:hypothetical protein
MAVEAPISKHKKGNVKIYIGACIVGAVVFAYDGYLSKYKWSGRYSFYKEHVLDNDGVPTSTMSFNRKSPPVFLAVAVLLGAYLLAIRKRKVVAEQEELVLCARRSIPYSSIQRIDKTYFESKGFFTVTYKDQTEREVNLKLNDRSYDNLAALLEKLVAEIS